MTAILLRKRKLGMGSCRGIQQFSAQGIRWYRNDGAIPNDVDVLFRWGCTSQCGAGLTVNTAEAIGWCSDKRTSRLAMQTAGVSVPETWGVNADRTYTGRPNAVDAIEVRPAFVARPCTHAQGRNLLVANWVEAFEQTVTWGGGYVSRLIPKVAEYRVFVSQGRAVWVARKTPGNPNDVAWNVARGGRFDNVAWDDWPLRVVKEAIKAVAVCPGLTFGGVDVMVDAEGVPYVLEINSAPSQTSPYRQECVAKAFDWIVRTSSKNVIPLSNERGGWRKFIHPALTDEAWV